jgi:hypothetical protein
VGARPGIPGLPSSTMLRSGLQGAHITLDVHICVSMGKCVGAHLKAFLGLYYYQRQNVHIRTSMHISGSQCISSSTIANLSPPMPISVHLDLAPPLIALYQDQSYNSKLN